MTEEGIRDYQVERQLEYKQKFPEKFQIIENFEMKLSKLNKKENNYNIIKEVLEKLSLNSIVDLERELIKKWGCDPDEIKKFEDVYNEDYFTGEIINMYKYIITRISEENNIPLDEINLQISHKLKTGRFIKTSLTYPIKYTIHNLDEILNLLDAEETTQQIRIGKHTHFLEIKDKEKEKQLYKDEKEWREQKYGKQ